MYFFSTDQHMYMMKTSNPILIFSTSVKETLWNWKEQLNLKISERNCIADVDRVRERIKTVPGKFNFKFGE